MTRFDQIETQFNARFDHLKIRMGQVEQDVRELKADVRELKIAVQGIKAHLFKIEERIRDLDDKVDAFVRESRFLKRELRDFQASLSPRG